jgi:EAL domain-containing protein (putative c-di-GMP-specific phosphodiesterase class I)
MGEACSGCRGGERFNVEFSIAFQPIVNLRSREVFGHEALVRGVNGEGAASILGMVNNENRYYFDQQCRVKAIQLAAKLFPASDNLKLSINFMPNAVYEPRACIRLTLETAERFGFPLENIIFEFTEDERLDTQHVLRILETYRAIGFKTAIDDFGAGHAGLGLLGKYQPDIVKLDMELIRNIHTDRAKRIIVQHTLRMLEDLGITPLCEGIEHAGELAALEDMGVCLMQGYLLARPAFEALAKPSLAT